MFFGDQNASIYTLTWTMWLRPRRKSSRSEEIHVGAITGHIIATHIESCFSKCMWNISNTRKYFSHLPLHGHRLRPLYQQDLRWKIDLCNNGIDGITIIQPLVDSPNINRQSEWALKFWQSVGYCWNRNEAKTTATSALVIRLGIESQVIKPLIHKVE